MIDPVSIAAIKGACDVAIGALPQIFPLVHDETTRKRLARLDILLQRVEDGSLTSEELTEAKKLHSKIHVHALMIQNATIMTYLKKGMLLLGAKMSGTAEEQVDLIMMDEDCEERLTQENSITRSPPTPMSVKFKASIPEVAKFISFDERSLLFDASGFITQYIAPSEAAQPAYSSRSSATISSLRDEEEKEDPIIEESRFDHWFNRTAGTTGPAKPAQVEDSATKSKKRARRDRFSFVENLVNDKVLLLTGA